MCDEQDIRSLIALLLLKLAETVNLLKLWTTVASQPYVGLEWFFFGAVERNVYFNAMLSYAMFACCMLIVSSTKVATLLLVHWCLYKVDTLLPCVYSTVSPIDAWNIPWNPCHVYFHYMCCIIVFAFMIISLFSSKVANLLFLTATPEFH